MWIKSVLPEKKYAGYSGVLAVTELSISCTKCILKFNRFRTNIVSHTCTVW